MRVQYHNLSLEMHVGPFHGGCLNRATPGQRTKYDKAAKLRIGPAQEGLILFIRHRPAPLAMAAIPDPAERIAVKQLGIQAPIEEALYAREDSFQAPRTLERRLFL